MTYTNTFNDWIRQNCASLSLSGLDHYLEIPDGTMARFMGNGQISIDHRKKAALHFRTLLDRGNEAILQFALDRLGEHRTEMAKWHARTGIPADRASERDRDIENAKNEQRLEDLIQLYCILLKTNPECAEFLGNQLLEFNPPALEAVKMMFQDGQMTGGQRIMN